MVSQKLERMFDFVTRPLMALATEEAAAITMGLLLGGAVAMAFTKPFEDKNPEINPAVSSQYIDSKSVPYYGPVQVENP